MNAMRLILALSAGVLATCTAAQETGTQLGRLFLTPEWRAQLERQRQLNLQEARTLEGGTMRLDGMVVRSSGKSTVWINNRPQTESTHDAGVTVVPSPRQPGRALLTPGGESPADLKVGQTINRATRETAGGLAAGEIRVNRSAPRP